jgi:ribosomal protein L6P/L9E
MSKSTAKKASSSINYQDDVNIALDCEHDIDATVDEEDEEDDEGNGTESASQVKAAVQKVSFDFVIPLRTSYRGYYSSFEKSFAQYAQLLSIVKVGLGKSKPQMFIVVQYEPT